MSSLNFPKAIGHRGACGYAPENTIESVITAADMGIKWVELDVKLTKDSIPVIFHDDTLDRTTNGQGKICEWNYEDLKQLECGSWYADSFAGIGVPTLEEMIDTLIKYDLGLNLEIKPCTGREAETTEIALDLLSHYWDNHDNLLISSFSHISLETSMQIAQDWHRGLLMEGNIDENWQKIAELLDVSAIIIDGNNTSYEKIREFMSFEKPIMAFTIDDYEKAIELQSWGVDAFISNTPDIIEENLLPDH